jgi:IS30 family transposase
MAHTELNLRERRTIEDMLNAKMSVGEIAAEIGRHKSTVYHEIKRNYYNDEEIPYLTGYAALRARQMFGVQQMPQRPGMANVTPIGSNPSTGTGSQMLAQLARLGRLGRR